MASQSFVSPSWDHPSLYMDVNYKMTVNLFESCLVNNINPLITWRYPELNQLPYIAGEDEYLVLGTLGLYAGSFLLDDSNGQHAGIMAMKAITYSYLYVNQ